MTTETGKRKRSADFFISNPFSRSFQQENVLTHSQSPENSYTPFVCSMNGQVESHCDSSKNCRGCCSTAPASREYLKLRELPMCKFLTAAAAIDTTAAILAR